MREAGRSSASSSRHAADDFRRSPHEYIPQGKVDTITRRVPPKTEDMRSKGGLLGQIYPALSVPPFAGTIRPSFPRFGTSRAEVSQLLPGGGMKEFMRVCFDETTPSGTVSAVYIAEEVRAH